MSHSSESASNADNVMDVDNVHRLLYVLDERKITRLAKQNSYVGTASSGPNSDKPATLIKNAPIELGADQAYYPQLQGSRMEVSFTLCPRSSSAYNNGPDGNAVLESYKDASQCPDGILVETSKANETHFQKTATHDGIVWSVFVFPSGFLQHARSYEWSTSGPPVNTDARQFAVNVTQALDATFERHAKKLNKSFKPNANGPENTMFVFAKRSVFVPSPAPLDEGRASDYNDPFSVLGKFPDFKFNRIPEVLVIDHAHKRSVPMSFHHLHLLERSVVLQVVTEPRAFVHKGSLGWDYRLTCIKVLGKKDSALAISPSKMVQKRQQYFLDDDDDDDDGQPQDKRPRTA